MHTKKIVPITLVIVLLLAGIAGIALWSQNRAADVTSTYTKESREYAQQKTGTGTTSKKTDVDVLELQNLGGATFAAYNQDTDTAGSITFNKEVLIPEIGFETPVMLFGQPLPKNTDSDAQRLNPNLEIHGLAEQIDIIAAIDGVVGFIRQQLDSSDYEVFLQPVEGSDWTIGYDHVVDVTVKMGDTVKAGDIIGKAAPDKRFGYYYEFQVNEDNTPEGTIMHCPTLLLTADVQDTVRDSLNTFVADWATWYGKDVYGEQAGGCIRDTLTAAESEGR